MADLDDSSFSAMQDTDTDPDSPMNVTLMQQQGKNINFFKAQLDAIERVQIISYAALAVRDI